MMTLAHLWVYLETTPLLGLSATLLAYQFGLWCETHSQILGRFQAIANPFLIAIVSLVALLLVTQTPYAAFFDGAKFVHFLLGPATVALAIPMYANLSHIRATARALIPAIIAGSLTASASAIVIAQWLGATPRVVLSLAPKSVTTPIAMGVAEQIGGDPSLTAVFVLMTGLTGATIMGAVIRLIRVRDIRAFGLAGGTAGHGFATAQLLRISETAGAFGGLAIGLNGLITAITLPLIAGWLVTHL